MTLPTWVKKHRQPGTEIKNIGGRFYVYEVSSLWDSTRKRAKKVSGKILGKISKDEGFIKREAYRQPTVKLPVLSKEYGATVLLEELMGDSIKQLAELFPAEWQQIAVTAYAQLVHQSPLKNIELHYEHSYLSERYPGVQVGSKIIRGAIHRLGMKRDLIRKVLLP